MREIIKKAQELYDLMEKRTRENGDEFYCFPNRTEETRKVSDAAHHEGVWFADDFIYSTLNECLSFISDLDPEGTVDDFHDKVYSEIESDVYTYDLTKWLHSDVRRAYYLTEVLEEMEVKDGFKLLRLAQLKEVQEIYCAVFEAIRELVDSKDSLLSVVQKDDHCNLRCSCGA